MLTATPTIHPRLEVLLTGNLERAHDSLDNAVELHANLIAVAMRVRAEAGVSGTVGQPELLKLARGLSEIVSARGSFIEGHAGLLALGERLGLVKNEGGVVIKDPDNALRPAASLQAVSG